VPEENVLTDAELDMLIDEIREHYGIETREDAMQFLLKRYLRRAAHNVSGRGRALHIVRERGRS